MTSNTLPSVGLRKMFGVNRHMGNSTFYQDSKSHKIKCLKKGWLKKPGLMRSWQQRWYIVKGDHMCYFTSEDETKSPVGRIFLPGNDVVELPHNNSDPDKYLFQIVPGGDKTRKDNGHEAYLLAAANENERREWVRIIRKVIYAEKGGAIFGQSLWETMQYEDKRSHRSVPQIVEQCAQFIMQYGEQVEGIFRLPGRSILIRSLREEFDCGRHPRFSLPQTDIHSVASLLKQFLRELPEPIIPFQLYERVIQICTRDMHTNEEKAVKCLSDLLRTMPHPQYNLLQYVCGFLHTISQSADVNKMTAMNLATIFMHCFIRPEEDDPVLLMGTSSGRTQAVFILISKSEQIFTRDVLEETVPVDDLLGLSISDTASEPELLAGSPIEGYTQVIHHDTDIFKADLEEAKVSASLPEPLFPAMPKSDNNVKNNVTPVVHPRSSFTKRETICYDPSTSTRRYSLSSSQPVCPAVSPQIHRSQSHDTIAHKSPPFLPSKPQGLRSSMSYNGRNTGTLSSTSSPLTQRTVSITSIDTSNSESIKIDFEHDEDDEALDTLINTELSEFSQDDLYAHVETLCSELREQRNMIKELNSKVLRLEERHSRQQEKMAEKVHLEKAATATAVQRIVDLQAQIQSYQMKYGPLD